MHSTAIGLGLLMGVATAAGSAVSAQVSEPAADSLRPQPIPGLDAYVEQVRQSWQAPGLALVLVRGDSVLVRGYGVREVGGTDPVDGETLFPIGSLTKAFTATLLAMLVDEGKIAWDDPVIRHLPDFKLRDPYVTRELTIRDALSHRSGIARGDLMWVGGSLGPREVIRRLRFQEPAFGFRARYGYTNEAYLLAGEVAAHVAGKPWSELLRERIFEPLGMRRSTATLDALRDRANVALPHDEIGPGQVLGNAPRAGSSLDAPTAIRRIEWFESPAVAAGGIVSSASEFGRWLRFQLSAGEAGGRRIVGREALLATHTPQVPIPGFPANRAAVAATNLNAAGMGWSVRDYRGRLMLTHSGSTPGWGAAVALLPAERTGVAVFVNITQGLWPANSVMRWLLDRLLDAELEDWNEQPLKGAEQRRQAEVAARKKAVASCVAGMTASRPLEAYAGTYTDSLYPPARVMLRNGRLRFSLGPLLAGDLDHWQGDTFRVTWDREEFGANLVTFHLSGGARPDSVQARILGTNAVWRRSEEPPDQGESSWVVPLSTEPGRALAARLTFNGRTAWFMFDTGAGTHTLARWFVDAAGITVDSSRSAGVRARDATGTPVAIDVVGRQAGRLPNGRSLVLEAAIVADFPSLFQQSEVGGLLNPQLLATAGQAAVLDLRVPELRMEPFDLAVRRLGAEVLSSDRVRQCTDAGTSIPNLLFGVLVSAGEGKEGWLQLDTGAGATSIAASSRLVAGRELIPGGKTMGVAGKPQTYSTAPGLTISFGSHGATLDAEVVEVARGGGCGPDGLLGREAVETCALVLGRDSVALACK
jgi:CubicO group peptidase (beta-lactamase class C family)